MGEVEDLIREELRKGLEEALSKAPWWCVLCGEGGNYDGERPDEYWFPPEDHVCKSSRANPNVGKIINPVQLMKEF